MNWLQAKICDWLGITKSTSRIQSAVDQNTVLQLRQRKELFELSSLIKERTEYNLDIHQLNGSKVIMIGKHNGTDFVHCYSIDEYDFNHLIQHCMALEKYSHRNKMDAWPSFKATINNELSKVGY